MDTKVLIALMLGILVAFQMLPTIVDLVTQSKTLYPVSTEWHNNTAVNALVQTAHYPVQTDSEVIKAYNGSTLAGTLVEGTNYTVIDYDEGKFNITDMGALPSANITVDYQWHYSGYLQDSGSRAIAGIFTTMLILGIVYYVGQASGLV